MALHPMLDRKGGEHVARSHPGRMRRSDDALRQVFKTCEAFVDREAMSRRGGADENLVKHDGGEVDPRRMARLKCFQLVLKLRVSGCSHVEIGVEDVLYHSG